MGKSSFISLIFIILISTSHAQGIYSEQSLEKDSLPTLNLHLERAQKLKKTGKIMSIVGPVSFIAGISLMSLGYSDGGTEVEFLAGSLLLLGGVVSTVVGLPILITNSSRVKRIKSAINNQHGLSFNIAPGFVYNNNAQKFYPGITLRIRI